MSSSVTPLTPLTDARHDPKLVARLEAVLAEARAGRVKYLVWALLDRDDVTTVGFSENALTLELVGLCELAKASLIKNRTETFVAE